MKQQAHPAAHLHAHMDPGDETQQGMAAAWKPSMGCLAGMSAMYAVATLLSVVASRHSGPVAPLWLANGIGMVLLAAAPSRSLPYLLAALGLGNWVGGLIGGDSMLRAVIFVPANLLSMTLAALLLRRRLAELMVCREPWRLVQMVAPIVILPPVAGALLFAFVLHGIEKASFGTAWLNWYQSDIVGTLATLPLALALLTTPWKETQHRLFSLRSAAWILVATGTPLVAFSWLPFPFIYIALPLLGAAMSSGLLVTAAANLASISAASAAMALGLFALPPINAGWEPFFMYLPLAIAMLPALLLAVTMEGLARSQAELRHSVDQLSRTNQELEHFVRVASHDLRDPLNAITGFADLALTAAEPLAPDQTRRYFQHMKQAALRMCELIDALLAYVRLDRQESMAEQDVKLNDVLDGVLSNLSAVLRASGTTVKHDELPIVRGHPAMLGLLLQNLISNALKFVPPGRVPEVHIGWYWRSDGSAVLQVSDNGIGIAEADIGRLFTPFVRLRTSTRYEGTGLGLATCKRVAELHHGRLWAESQPGGGTTFCMEFPTRDSAS
ncbi:sensor histidine kinase [Roseateles cavernae]|uniref:sensor histidine kinase n=1 Tax=Roseateles cavernae TaxID=3153578 RepID=UPI0032E3AACD